MGPIFKLNLMANLGVTEDKLRKMSGFFVNRAHSGMCLDVNNIVQLCRRLCKHCSVIM